MTVDKLQQFSAAGWIVFALMFIGGAVFRQPDVTDLALFLVGPGWLLAYSMHAQSTEGADLKFTIVMLVVVFGFLTVGNFVARYQANETADKVSKICLSEAVAKSEIATRVCDATGVNAEVDFGTYE